MKKLIIGILSLAISYSCTNLDEDLKDAVGSSSDGVAAEDLLTGAYSSLRELQSEQNLFAAYVHSSDELIPPTRGADWDDAGAWRAHHFQTWTNSHPHIARLWRALNSRAFAAQSVLCNGDASAQQEAEATFLRVFSDYLILDLWGKVPRRECDEDLLLSPTGLITRADGIGVLIAELEAVITTLPAGTNPIVANQNAANALLAKMYLNKGVYEATSADGGAVSGPYTFSPEDMNKAIGYINAISGRSLASNYFDSFVPDNTNTSSELLFVSENVQGGATGDVLSRWHMTMHYNQNPSGWNGFVSTTELYNLFESQDLRLKQNLPEITNNGGGFNAGFLVDQQFNADGSPVLDRQGNNLAFTSDVDILNSSEEKGIRVVKYIPDYVNDNNPDNDYVFLRYADARLMKAEAILRGGADSETALDIINELRSLRNASTLTSVTEKDILDERSRELYWEGWRRQDQIRFNTYLGTWQEKSETSTEKALLMPIPAEAISSDPNLIQNPGY